MFGTMFDALKQVLGDGEARTLREMGDEVFVLSDRTPSANTLNVYLARLRKSGYRFERAKDVGVSVYKLKGRKGRGYKMKRPSLA